MSEKIFFELDKLMRKDMRPVTKKPLKTSSSANHSLPVVSFLSDLYKWFPAQLATAQHPYITLTKQCNALLQHILDSKRIKLNHASFSFKKKKHAESNSNNLMFVHLLQQILWEDKERELAAPELRKKGQVIMNPSDLQIAGNLMNAWLKKEGLLKAKAT